jgi:rhamnulokinase
MGMWLLQGCRRTWTAQGSPYDYGALVGMASTQPVLRSVIEPDHPSFLRPDDMTAAIRDFCKRTGQPVPSEPAEYVQTIIESLALKYRYVHECLERITGQQFDEIRVVGGGARNRVLNQFTADATGCRVVAGPVEATALGNIAMQMVATGQVASIVEARALIDRSFPTEQFLPRLGGGWDRAYAQLQQMQGAAAGGN